MKLPPQYCNLYSETSYDFLIPGSTKSDNWYTIKRQHDSELHDVFASMSPGNNVWVYVTTCTDDKGSKNFGLAFTDCSRMNETEVGIAVAYIRRMYTGLYDNMKTLLADTDEKCLQKLKSNNDAQGKLFTEWKCREYSTQCWFYNDLGHDKYMEVIFSSDKAQLGNVVYEFEFDTFDGESLPLPRRKE